MILPVEQHLNEILSLWKTSPAVILTAPPGSGKTLKVPPLLLKSLMQSGSQKKIIVLVPKRIAALSAASKISRDHSWSLGANEIGYQVRFDHQLTEKTQLIFMTEGVFIKRLTDTKFIESIDTIIFDEFHERSAQNDLALGYCLEKQILEQNLKILIMSATLDTQQLEQFLPEAQTLQIEAKPYPLNIIRNSKAQRLQCDPQFFDDLFEITKKASIQSQKDILIFLPGLHEIRQAHNRLKNYWPNTPIEILHGSIRLDEQERILQPSNLRRIILSTNIAESSLTLPSVDTVIDSGLEKKLVIENKIGFHRLEIKRTSLFSAKQRAGRAARTGPGFCYQMWHESDERSMSTAIEPEILKSNLLQETLTLAALEINQPDQFSWLTPPLKKFTSAQAQLKNWKLLDDNLKLTQLGELVQKCPLDTERATLFCSLSFAGYQQEASHFLAFIETHDFSKTTHEYDFEHLELCSLGHKIKQQLLKLSFKNLQIQPAQRNFKTELLKTYLKLFPEKMAQKKEGALGVSSLGRGIRFLSHLVTKNSDYFILLAGHEISDSLTQIDFSIDYTEREFFEVSQLQQTTQTTYKLDFERQKIYQYEQKLSGFFAVSAEVKSEVSPQKGKEVLKKLFETDLNQFLQAHPDWLRFENKLNFLFKKNSILKINLNQNTVFLDLQKKLIELLQSSINSFNEFFELNLYQSLLYLIPQELQQLLSSLPDQFQLPNGKNVPITYAGEQAPLVSVKIQDVFGVKKNPHLIDEKIRITFELLAPNYRPAQITSQLEQFWTTSYLDVRKDLRARYPKHDWPDNPLDWSPEMSKRFQKTRP